MPYKDKEREREYKKTYNKKYNQEHKEERKENRKGYYQKNRKEILKKQKKYNSLPEVKQERKEYNKKYRQENEEKEKRRHKKYRQENEEKDEQSKKKWKEKNPNYPKEYIKNRLRTDKDFAIAVRLRRLLKHALKKYTKTGKIMSSKKYGIDYKAIIKQLKPIPKDLSKYHIDHKRPLCSFQFIKEDGSTNLKEVKKAFAPENHQWLTIQENLRKGGEYE